MSAIPPIPTLGDNPLSLDWVVVPRRTINDFNTRVLGVPARHVGPMVRWDNEWGPIVADLSAVPDQANADAMAHLITIAPRMHACLGRLLALIRSVTVPLEPGDDPDVDEAMTLLGHLPVPAIVEGGGK